MMKKRKTAKVVLLSILCFVLVMLLGAGAMLSLGLRMSAQDGDFMTAVEKVPLADLPVENSTAAQYILDEFIQDERVNVQNVEKVMEEGTFSAFAAELVEKYNAYLLEGGEFPQLSEEDFIRLIEENETLILEETGLKFLEPDKQKLRENLAPMIAEWNSTAERSLHKGVSGFAVRASFSIWLPAVLGVMLLLLLIWMLVFYVRGGFRAGTALKVYSIALLVPSLLLFAAANLTDVIVAVKLPVFAQADNTLYDAADGSGYGILLSVALFLAGMLCNLIASKRKPAMVEEIPLEAPAESESAVKAEPAEELVVTEPAPEPKRQFCRNCGQPLVNPDAKFCYKCGNVQEHVSSAASEE